MELDITSLREQGRPLWMSTLGIEDYADMLGGGGDIYLDRLPPAWARYTGEELTDDEAKEFAESKGETWEAEPMAASEVSSAETAPSETASAEAAPAEAAPAEAAPAEAAPAEEPASGVGVGVAADANVKVTGGKETVQEVTGIVGDTVEAVGGILSGLTKGVKKTVKSAVKKEKK